MLEIEIKYQVDDFAELEKRLREWRAEPKEDRSDIDEYFQAPYRDFARTDEAFRLRRIGAANFVTYKGPRTDAATKTRLEIEVPLAEGDEPAEDFESLVKALGFRPVTLVRKQRRTFGIQREGFEIEVCLDTVAEVGKYAELEIMAPDETLERARSVLLQIAQELGLNRMERRSYLELLLATRSKNS